MRMYHQHFLRTQYSESSKWYCEQWIILYLRTEKSALYIHLHAWFVSGRALSGIHTYCTYNTNLTDMVDGNMNSNIFLAKIA